jgi:hypothetical protein
MGAERWRGGSGEPPVRTKARAQLASVTTLLAAVDRDTHEGTPREQAVRADTG